MSLLLWHSMREAKRRGNTQYDLEGSMDEGVERFFRNFGGDRALYIVLLKNRSLLWQLKKLVFK
jgi:lipid II:glycine glycyltransferase (peptidoglycan interpeptide bridge formation enzyme)